MNENYNKKIQEESLENSKSALKQDARGFFSSLKLFLLPLYALFYRAQLWPSLTRGDT